MLYAAFAIGALLSGATVSTVLILANLLPRNRISPEVEELKPSAWPYLVWPVMACIIVFAAMTILLHVLDINIFDQETWFQLDETGAKLNPAEGARDVFLSIGGVTATIVAALTFGNAMRRSATMERQEAIAKRVEANDRRRLAGDTFSKAAELLGASDEAQRLGGLHSLELLSRGVDEYTAQQISNTISAFIRANSKPYLDIVNADVEAQEVDCEESLKSAIIILLRRFGETDSKTDLSNSYIKELAWDKPLKNVAFDGSWIGDLSFSEKVSGVSFNRLKKAHMIAFDKGVIRGTFQNSTIDMLDFASMNFIDEELSADFRLSGVNVNYLAFGEGIDVSRANFGYSRVNVLYAQQLPTLRPEQLFRVRLDDIEGSYLPQSWTEAELEALLASWRERDANEADVPF